MNCRILHFHRRTTGSLYGKLALRDSRFAIWERPNGEICPSRDRESPISERRPQAIYTGNHRSRRSQIGQFVPLGAGESPIRRGLHRPIYTGNPPLGGASRQFIRRITGQRGRPRPAGVASRDPQMSEISEKCGGRGGKKWTKTALRQMKCTFWNPQMCQNQPSAMKKCVFRVLRTFLPPQIFPKMQAFDVAMTTENGTRLLTGFSGEVVPPPELHIYLDLCCL